MDPGGEPSELEFSCQQEITDLTTLSEIFEPHIKFSMCKSFKMTGERYVWATAKSAHELDLGRIGTSFFAQMGQLASVGKMEHAKLKRRSNFCFIL